MTRLLQAKIALAFIGAAMFGWSIWADDERVRLAAIGTLVVAFVLRFAGRRRPATESTEEG
ncbi:MAG: hypothetical protein MUF40_04845 [Gemmatimonadaceae bacterium]|jgi:hypothetical protein|nr:hypothetical protein [Gemmatimonadaceae bacterium]